MVKCITVDYLKHIENMDISTNDKMQVAINKIIHLILNKIRPLYTIVLINLYDIELLEQTFEEDGAYKAIEESVKGYIYENICGYIEDNEHINIEGFIIFRLKSLWDIIDNAAREYLLLKDEYCALTEFLSNYTNNAPKICDTIKVIVEDDNYSVYDADMKMIAFVKNYDDTLLDIILNIAPNKIIIYNYNLFSNKMLLENIMAIFKEKVILEPST